MPHGWRKQNRRYHHIEDRKFTIEPFLQPQGAECRYYDHSTYNKGLRSTVPSEQRIDHSFKQSTHSLSMWSMLPPEHLPQRVPLEKCCVIEVPLVHIKD